jgi:hypothetical protein
MRSRHVWINNSEQHCARRGWSPGSVDEQIEQALVTVEGTGSRRDLPDRHLSQHDLSVPSAGLSLHPDL